MLANTIKQEALANTIQQEALDTKLEIAENKKFYITKCRLYNFRNYHELEFEPCQGINIIHGENGSGKTNFLEAISLFSAGKGIRSENIDKMFQYKTHRFNLEIEVVGPVGITNIQIQAQKNHSDENEKSDKKILVDGNIIKKNTLLNQAVRQVWVNTNPELLIEQTPCKRRKFFDKLVTIFYPEHAKVLLEYEKAVAQRQKILQNYQLKYTSWIDCIERKMVDATSVIAARRIQFCRVFNQHANKLQQNNPFNKAMPKVQIHINGFAENIMRKLPAVEVEEQMMDYLKNQRQQHMNNSNVIYPNMYYPRIHKGAHVADMQIFDCQKKCYASQCSTGERKLLVIAIVFIQLLLMRKITFGFLPILLFDEFRAHIDEKKQQLILNEIKNLNVQAFVTTTEYHNKQFNNDKTQIFNCNQNQIRKIR